MSKMFFNMLAVFAEFEADLLKESASKPARGPGHHPRGRLVFHVFAALAEFIRKLIIEGAPTRA